MDSVETRTMRKVSARLIPFLILCYFIAFLDPLMSASLR